jgi:hypothetical protein
VLNVERLLFTCWSHGYFAVCTIVCALLCGWHVAGVLVVHVRRVGEVLELGLRGKSRLVGTYRACMYSTIHIPQRKIGQSQITVDSRM